MNNTPAEQIATAANTFAYAHCKAKGIETVGNSRLDKFNPVFNAAYVKEWNRLFNDIIERETSRNA